MKMLSGTALAAINFTGLSVVLYEMIVSFTARISIKATAAIAAQTKAIFGVKLFLKRSDSSPASVPIRFQHTPASALREGQTLFALLFLFFSFKWIVIDILPQYKLSASFLKAVMSGKESSIISSLL